MVVIMDKDFVNASDVPQLDQKLLDEYYYAKIQLSKWERQEQELKDQIKSFMIDKNIQKLNTEHMFLTCNKVERITYPKGKVEEFVPQEILEQIRTITETIVLQTKIKT